MKPGDYRICPACSTRNKPKWEFCAKCGESLQGVSTGEPEVAPMAPAPVRAAEVVDMEDGFPWGSLVVLAVFVAAVVAAIYAKPDRPVDAAIFGAATTIPAAPPAPAAVVSPAEAAFAEGRNLLASGDVVRGVDRLGDAVALAGDNALYRHTYGKALWQAGRKAEAIGQWQIASRLDPGTDVYAQDLARGLEDAGDTAGAVAAYEALRVRKPFDPGVLRALGRLYTASGQPEKALPLLRQAVEVSPTDARQHVTLAYAMEKGGNFEGAAEIYRKVLEEFPDGAVTRSLLAENLFKSGKRADAADLLRTGLQRTPQEPVLHKSLATVLERTGKLDEAAAEYREYARLAPQAPDARQMVERAAKVEEYAATRANGT
jgi:Flp pilus assembly protein TadD